MKTPAALMIAASMLIGGTLLPAAAQAQHWNHSGEAQRHYRPAPHWQSRHETRHDQWQGHRRHGGCYVVNERRWSRAYHAWVMEPVRVCR